MWPPFLNDLKPIRFGIKGHAYTNGFDLTAVSSFAQKSWKFIFRDPEYSEQDTIEWSLVGWLVGAFGVSLYFHGWFIIYVLIAQIFHALRTDSVLFYRRWKSWHWCEHQMANLVEQHRVSQKDLSAQSPISINCGSVHNTLLHLIIAGTFGWFPHVGGMAWISAAIAGSAFFAWLALRVSRNCCLVPFSYLGLPAFLIAMGMERLLYLRKPNAQQIDYALFWGAEAQYLITQALLKDASEYANAQS